MAADFGETDVQGRIISFAHKLAAAKFKTSADIHC